MFTCLIRRSRQHAATATILQDLPLQTVRGESAGPVVSAVPEESVGPVESAGPEVLVNRGELAGPAASGVQGELAEQGELARVLDQTLSAERILPTGWQDHLLAHTIPPKPGRTREPIPT